mmetsp:Transcript_624/g.1428  ORF Transcript_624/g.1428 Transcript_624/m.1428 type:complete len:224 (-) Transcript_624:540-1211(-)
MLPPAMMGSTSMSSPLPKGTVPFLAPSLPPDIAVAAAWTLAMMPALVGIASRRSQTRECVSASLPTFLQSKLLSAPFAVTGSDSSTEMSMSKNRSEDPSGPFLENNPVRSSDNAGEEGSAFDELPEAEPELGSIPIWGLSESSAMISLPSVMPRSAASVVSGMVERLARPENVEDESAAGRRLRPVRLFNFRHFSSWLQCLAIWRLIDARVWRGCISKGNRSG